MYAVVRLNSFDVNKLTDGAGKLNEFDQAHAAQPGYLGIVVVDLQAGRRLVLNLWDSEEHAADARSVLGQTAGRLLNPLMSKPSELLGAGPVISADLSPPKNA
jgi:hypothetical protein